MVLDAVTSFLGLGASAPPSVRRPVFEITFGGDADAWRERVTSISVVAGLFPSMNAADVIFDSQGAPDIALADVGEIKLGYEDSESTLVFTGQILSLSRTLDRSVRLTAVDGGSALAYTRQMGSYEQQTAGDIVKNLAGTVSLQTDVIEDGADFPYYVVDNGRSFHQHVAALGRKSGYIAYVSPEGKLNFKPFVAGQAVQTFAYATDILALRVTESAPLFTQITVQGEGAAGSEGSEAWHWLMQSQAAVKGVAGSGSPISERLDPSLRSSDAAAGAANGRIEAVNWMKIAGELHVPGAPAAFPGSAIAITGAPDDALNGQCLVRWVKHTYSKRVGFISHIGFSKVGDAAGGAGGLLETLGSLL